MIRKKVILDVDPGVDDALAILLALQSAELDVRGITVANGNVPLSIGLQNALKIVELACSDIDVYAGAAEPLRTFMGIPVLVMQNCPPLTLDLLAMLSNF